MRQEMGKDFGFDETGYSAYDSTFVLSWSGRTQFAHIYPLTIYDLNEQTRREWLRGRIIGWPDLQDYVRRRVTLIMKRRGRVLGVLHLSEPRWRSRARYPEVVAVEANPRTRRNVRGVGTGLMAAAVMTSKEWGFGGALELMANHRAVGFYSRLGMKRKRGSRNRFYFDEQGANQFLRAYLGRLSKTRKQHSPGVTLQFIHLRGVPQNDHFN